MNRLVVCALAAAALTLGPAQASVTEVSGGYQTSYDFYVPWTLNGNDVTNLVILETDGANYSADYGHGADAGSLTTLSHTISFRPTAALLIGLDLAVPGVGDGKTHLMMGLDTAFITPFVGQLFAVVFPVDANGQRVSHSQLIAALLGAEGGNAADAETVRYFFMDSTGANAGFDVNGPFTVAEFSTTVIVPEPASWALMILGFAALGYAVRRRARAV